MSMTLSRLASPSIESCAPGRSDAPWRTRAAALNRISLTRVDLPEPETPVTAVNSPIGKRDLIFLRLFSRAPEIVIHFPVGRFRFRGTATESAPERYFPVRDRSKARSS